MATTQEKVDKAGEKHAILGRGVKLSEEMRESYMLERQSLLHKLSLINKKLGIISRCKKCGQVL